MLRGQLDIREVQWELRTHDFSELRRHALVQAAIRFFQRVFAEELSPGRIDELQLVLSAREYGDGNSDVLERFGGRRTTTRDRFGRRAFPRDADFIQQYLYKGARTREAYGAAGSNRFQIPP
jgi:hypothetical protein